MTGESETKRKTVLVLPAGTELGLEVRASLDDSKFWRVVGANSVRDHSEVSYREVSFNLPFATASRFQQAVAQLVASLKPDFLIPAHDDAIFELAGVPLGETVFVGPSTRLAAILRLKSRTYGALKDVLPCPRIFAPSEAPDAHVPLFVRPDRGQGSRGARSVNSAEELAAALQATPDLVVTEYLPGEEFTVDCYTDRHGELIFSSARRRSRVSNGISVRADEVDHPRFRDAAQRVGSALDIRGAWFFQMKEDAEGVPRLLEVANRVSGTMGFQRERGVNLIEAWLHELGGREVGFLPWAGGPMVYDRALAPRVRWDYKPETIYVDLDDTLLLPGAKLNYRLVGQLFGLKFNLGARIVLITRHRREARGTLSAYGLNELFDDVRQALDGQRKSDLVDAGPAVFIDDSFSERADVARRRGIPTFPVEAMACLEGLNHFALA